MPESGCDSHTHEDAGIFPPNSKCLYELSTWTYQPNGKERRTDNTNCVYGSYREGRIKILKNNKNKKAISSAESTSQDERHRLSMYGRAGKT